VKQKIMHKIYADRISARELLGDFDPHLNTWVLYWVFSHYMTFLNTWVLYWVFSHYMTFQGLWMCSDTLALITLCSDEG
jgi:hypothetical protein